MPHDFASPLISVVIPTYNRAQFLPDALNSVKCQSHRPIEIVVVDDGSSDGTQNIIQDWKQLHSGENLEVVYHFQENQGGNVARNRGVKTAKGTYIAFLDSDDLWHSAKLEKQLNVINTSTEVGAVYCGLRQVVFETGAVESPPPRAYPSGLLLNQLLVKDVTAPTSTYMVKAQVFEEVGYFDESLQARQDWDMWIRVASNYRIEVVPEILVDFRAHQGERTASNPMKEINAYGQILHKYASLRAAAPLPIRQAAKAAYFRRMGRVYFHHRLGYAKALRYQIVAICCWPFVFDSYAALLGMLIPRKFRVGLRKLWNRIFGATPLSIKSH